MKLQDYTTALLTPQDHDTSYSKNTKKVSFWRTQGQSNSPSEQPKKDFFPSLVLASSSASRHRLLSSLGLSFYVFGPNINEDPLPKELPETYVKRISLGKAQRAREMFQESLDLFPFKDLHFSHRGEKKPLYYNPQNTSQTQGSQEKSEAQTQEHLGESSLFSGFQESQEQSKASPQGLQEQSKTYPQQGLQEQSKTYPQQGLQEQSKTYPQQGLQEQSRTYPQQGLQEQSKTHPQQGLQEQLKSPLPQDLWGRWSRPSTTLSLGQGHSFDPLEHFSSFFPNNPPLIVAADTIVAMGRRILRKAENPEEARHQITLLSGRSHRVYSAITLFDPQIQDFRQRLLMTHVKFKHLESWEIEAFVASEDWKNVAVYRLHGFVARFVRRLNGQPSTVEGLPLFDTYQLLRGHGLCPENFSTSF